MTEIISKVNIIFNFPQEGREGMHETEMGVLCSMATEGGRGHAGTVKAMIRETKESTTRPKWESDEEIDLFLLCWEWHAFIKVSRHSECQGSPALWVCAAGVFW